MAVFAVFAVAGAAEAGSLLCPLDDSGNQLLVEWDGSGSIVCSDYGDGNTFPNGPTLDHNGTTYNEIADECEPECVSGSVDGSFDLTAYGPGEYLLLFKFGQGQVNPNWFVIFLDGVLEGDWALLPEDAKLNGLSHASLWGDPCERDCEPPPPVIPEPTSLLLLGSGLTAAAAARRRKAAKK